MAPAAPSQQQSVDRLARELAAEPVQHANHVSALLPLVGSGDHDVSAEAIKSLGAFFVGRHVDGTMAPPTKKRRARAPGGPEVADGGSSGGKESASAILAAWLGSAQEAFVRAASSRLWPAAEPSRPARGGRGEGAREPAEARAPAVGPALAARSALLALARARGGGGVPDAALMEAVLLPSVAGAGAPPELLRALCVRDARVPDLRYALCKALARLCLRWAEGGAAGVAEAEGGRGAAAGHPSGAPLAGADDFACNAYDLLRSLTAASARPEASREVEEAARRMGVRAGAVPGESAAKRRRRLARERAGAVSDEPADGPAADDASPPHAASSARWANPSAASRALASAWLSFLRLRLPSDIRRRVLVAIPETVIPVLPEPLRLADFLTATLDAGGFDAMLALHAIFLLVTKHGLEYPRFYERLYGLVDGDALVSHNRARFLTLADAFLASPMVPAYTAAAFTKRFARLALDAEPAPARISLAFIHNLVRRHPAISQLLGREGGPEAPGSEAARVAPPTAGPSARADAVAEAGVACADDGADEGAPATSARAPSVPSRPAGSVWQGVDPYDPLAPDPRDANALASSLWEVTVLRRHECPLVALAAQSLDVDLTDRRKTTELNVAELAESSGAALVDAELGRRVKVVALEFHREPPGSLIAGNSPAFAGWVDDVESVGP